MVRPAYKDLDVCFVYDIDTECSRKRSPVLIIRLSTNNFYLGGVDVQSTLFLHFCMIFSILSLSS